MFCKNCGSKLESDSLFCPNCGVKVNVNNNSSESQFYYQNNSASVNMVSVNNSYSRPKTTFIFVTTLIIMILFCIRFFSIIDVVSQYRELKSSMGGYPSYNAVLDALYIVVSITLFSAIFSIFVFIIVCTIRKKINSNVKYKNTANTLFIFSIINIVIYTLYVISIFNTIRALEYLISTGSNGTINYASFYGDILVCLTFISLMIVNLIKTIKLKMA